MAYSYRIIGYRDTNGYCESITSDAQLWDVEELAPKTREPVPFAFCDDDTEIVPHPVFVIEETGADGETFEFDFENHYWDYEEGSRKHIAVEDLSQFDRLLQAGSWESFEDALEDVQARMD
jgi:hypothetical protein